MDSIFMTADVAIAGMSRTLRAAAPHSAVAAHAGAPARIPAHAPVARMWIMPAIPAQRKRRAATAATRTSVKRGTI